MPIVKPLISVLIPVYNQFDLLEFCLKSLRNQSFSDFELIVVNDGSNTHPSPQLLKWIRSWPRLKWVQHRHNQGRAKARNTAIKEAKADLIIFLDADMIVPEDFIKQHWLFHCSHGPGWIGQGKIIETESFEIRPEASLWTDASRAYFATGNVSISRTSIEQVGGFDECFSEYGWEDLELGLRLKKLGHSAGRTGAYSYHYRKTETHWQHDIEKETARGKGAAYFLAKHPGLEVRLMSQLTPLHSTLDWLFRGAGLITEKTWLKWIQQIRKTNPSLSKALYSALLNHYCLKSSEQEWVKLKKRSK